MFNSRELSRTRQYPNTLKIRIGYRYMYFILSRSNRQCSSAELASSKKIHTPVTLEKSRYQLGIFVMIII